MCHIVITHISIYTHVNCSRGILVARAGGLREPYEHNHGISDAKRISRLQNLTTSRLTKCWVAVKELKVSYHNGYII